MSVIATDECDWTATSQADWITITSGASSFGYRTVTYSVAPNTETSQRIGTLTIAGQTFTVTQDAISFSLSGQITDAKTSAGIPNVSVLATAFGAQTQTTQTDANGNYTFSGLGAGSYTVTPSLSNVLFSPQSTQVTLGPNQTSVNFTGTQQPPPPPTPTPSPTPTPFISGTLVTQPPGAVNPQIPTSQQNGQFQISPLADVPGLNYNGFVTKVPIDLTNRRAALEVVQAATGGAQTLFAVGTDENNFFRFKIVSTPTATPKKKSARRGKTDTTGTVTTPQLIFEVAQGNGVMVVGQIDYDPVQDRFLRFRHEILDNPPLGYMFFETSPCPATGACPPNDLNTLPWVTQRPSNPIKVKVQKTVEALVAELSSGTSVSVTNPGTAVFDNFQLLGKTAPTITWNNPADITYPTPLSSTQLNATPNVPGTFAYNPPAGTVLNAGNNQTLSATFTPDDSINYTSATAQVEINVLPAQPSFSELSSPTISYGTSPTVLSGKIGAGSLIPSGSVSITLGTVKQSAAINSSDGSFSASFVTDTLTASTTPYPITYSYEGDGTDNNFAPVNSPGALTVTKATPTITWNNPADITYPTPLSGTQLNATASVPGTYVYNPPAGTVLSTGPNQTLSVTFMPSDATDYTTAMKSVMINVLPSSGTSTPIGSPVTVQTNGVNVTFTTVTAAGTTNASMIDPSAAGQLPPGYTIPNGSPAFDVRTTATYTGPITVCFTAPTVTDPAAFAQLAVLHKETGGLTDRTPIGSVSRDFSMKSVCASAMSLSPFVVAQNTAAPASMVQLDQATYTAGLQDNSLTIKVVRLGNTSGTSSIDYATQDGSATQKSDYTAAGGTLHFAAGEAAKTLTVLVTHNGLGKGMVTANLALSNPIGVSLDTPGTATLSIMQSPNQSATNPVDDPTFYVTQHYYDFLNRVPDQAGLNFWVSQITSCNGDGGCIDIKRQNVSAAYFLSVEFQQTGYLVHRIYRAAFGVPPTFAQFLPDTQQIGQGVIVAPNDGGGWMEKLEANKQAYVNAFVQGATFTALYNGLSNEAYVDKLIQNTGVTFSSTDHDALVNGLNNGTETRATVLRKVAENQTFSNSEFNRAFVEMQYFGYLRRDPDTAGYQFWLNKLNSFNGNYIGSQMVRSFIVSNEYRQRFGK